MQADPGHIFREIAPRPSGPPPVEAILRRARRQRRTSAVLASSLVAVVGTLGIALVTGPFAPSERVGPSAPVTRADLLARPLELPRLAAGEPCPITEALPGTAASGAGPVYVNTNRGRPYFQDPHDNGMSWYPKGWQLAKTPLYGDPGYDGPILLRGGRVDGEGVIRFDLADSVGGDMPGRLFYPAEERHGEEANLGLWFTVFSTAVDASGCYAYQIDGDGFTEHVVFEARLR